MSKFEYFRCDECGKILDNCECATNQLMFTLIANYDTSYTFGESKGGYKAHFCSQKCLLAYVEKKVKDHHDLPNIKDEDRPKESETLGDKLAQQEKHD